LVCADPVYNDEEKETSFNKDETSGEAGIKTGNLVCEKAAKEENRKQVNKSLI